MKIQTLGDPHLGRRFKVGVPLHRLGEREEMVWAQFAREVMETDADVHVNVGDLFDKFSVPATVVLRAADIYLAAARRNPETQYVVLRGNHDVSRDSEIKGSFDLFERLVAPAGVWVVGDRPKVFHDLGFVGYQPFRSAAAAVAELPDGLSAVFGHYDIVDFGGDNVIPTKVLAEKGILKAYTGHDHLARTFTRDGVEVIATGSLQPYTHAEDARGDLYRTVTLAELAAIDATNLNVRVMLQPGEVLPLDLNCLSITGKQVAADGIEIDTSEFESFDVAHMLGQVLEGFSIKDELMERFHAQS